MLTSTSVFGCVALVMTHVAVGIQFETDVLEKHMKVVAKHAPTRLGTQPNGSLGETCEVCPVGDCNRQVWGDISTPCKVYNNREFNCHYSASIGTCPPSDQRATDCLDSKYRTDAVDAPLKVFKISKNTLCRQFRQHLSSHTRCNSGSSQFLSTAQACKDKAVAEKKPYYSFSQKPNQPNAHKGMCTVDMTCQKPTNGTGWKWHIYTSFSNMAGDKCNSGPGRTEPGISSFLPAVCGMSPGTGVIRTFDQTTPDHIITNLAQCQHLCEVEDSEVCRAVAYRESSQICLLLNGTTASNIESGSDDVVSSDRDIEP